MIIILPFLRSKSTASIVELFCHILKFIAGAKIVGCSQIDNKVDTASSATPCAHLPIIFAVAGATIIASKSIDKFTCSKPVSPFLEGNATGVHSQRWIQFPKTPSNVPMFLDHSHYVKWVEEQLSQGNMHNERHLWTSVRPNGPERPHILNRLELRICDLVDNVDLLLAITALLELRIINLKNNIKHKDP